MVSAELIHNPYLLTTIVRFNEREPKVNSAIEKYEGQPLVDWAETVPRIFHDEMNGFDFDFFFSGTDADYERVIAAFQNQGVDGATVRIFRKGKLSAVETKRKQVGDLLTWLEGHRNRRFDYDGLCSNHPDLLDPCIPYIIIQEEAVQTGLPFVNVETVSSALDLAGTVLTNTPILFVVGRSNRQAVRKELQHILSITGIKQSQLFFLIHPAMNKGRIIRVISDLGVQNPQVIESPDDDRVIKFLYDYPVMDYIREAIGVLREAMDGIKEALFKVSRFYEATSAGTRNEINALDSEIESLKSIKQHLSENKSYTVQHLFEDQCKALETRIASWRNRKASVSGRDQIVRATLEYSLDLKNYLSDFELSVDSVMETEEMQIEQGLSNLYESITFVEHFTPPISKPLKSESIELPDVVGTLSNLTEISYVSVRNDIFGFLGASLDSNDKKPLEVANYEAWRSASKRMIMPLVHTFINRRLDELSNYYASLVEAYIKQLSNLISSKNRAKEEAASRLSDTEKRYQEDVDWVNEFDERLLEIERG